MDTTLRSLAAKRSTAQGSDSCKYCPMHEPASSPAGSSKDPKLQSTLHKCSKLESDADCEVICPQQPAA